MNRDELRLDSIFLDALEKASASERSAYLDGACGTDQKLRSRVERFLATQPKVRDFLESPAAGLAVTIDQGIEKPGTLLGPYKLLEQIGEGGMGLVFMAEQTQPIRRKVALKVLKPGMDTRHVVARFEAERQAVALMDHPNIAQVFDAGATPTGRPYFVMELVRGVPITEFCDQRRLTTRQRLELFVTVCHAVQHAHQKGIIHRDLKPSNILVTLHDTIGVPKIIDFGISKATKQPLTERSLFTHFSQMIGTPLYMSPEQAEMNGLDVDTRSDVYALGVLLYELLTGTAPFASERLKQIGFDEMRRVIREEEPPRPSQRVSTLDAAARSTLSEQRGTDVRTFDSMLRGELDWIVIKALEKDRNRRYESASAFAADVQRYLKNEAVEACPPSARYRLGKFTRRNRRALATAAIVFVALVSATAVSAWQAVVARDAQHQAEVDREHAKAAELRAATQADIANAVNSFLQQDLLMQVDINAHMDQGFVPNRKLTVREALDRAATRIGERFRDQPLVEAGIQIAIGKAYGAVGEHRHQIVHLGRALELRKRHLGPNHPDTLACMQSLATAYLLVGQAAEAIALNQQTLEKRQALLGPDDPLTLESQDQLAKVHRFAGQWERAISLGEQTLERRKAIDGPTHPQTVGAMHSLAMIHMDGGDLNESLALHEKALAIMKATISPARASLLGWVMNTYARALQKAGKLSEADRLLRQALDYLRKSDPTRDATGTENTLIILSLNLLLQDRFEEAESVGRDALGCYDHRPDGWPRFHAMSLVGGALLGQQKYVEAEPFLLQGYEGMKQREATMDASFKHWLTKSGERLVRLYEVTNQPEKARELREKLAPRERLKQ